MGSVKVISDSGVFRDLASGCSGRKWDRCVGFPDGGASPSLRQCATGGCSVQRSNGAVADPPPGINRAADNPASPTGTLRAAPNDPSAMADRENLVYQAKLAEQAERYDGKTPHE